MTPTEKAIYDFCGHHADWWPLIDQIKEIQTLAAPVQEPVAIRDAIVVNLLREGINKHRARELADHFIGLITPPAAQRQWVGLTDEERDTLIREFNGLAVSFYKAIETKLKEKNT